MIDLEALRGIVSDLESRLSRATVAAAPRSSGAVVAPSVVPYWSVVMGSSLDLPVNEGDLTEVVADWDPLFDETFDDRTEFRLMTVAGEISTFGTHGLDRQKRFVIQWDSTCSGSAACSLSGFYTEAGDTDWPIQVKMNGSISQLYPTPQELVLNFKEGRNRLAICMAGRPILLTFAGNLFGFDGAHWVAPN